MNNREVIKEYIEENLKKFKLDSWPRMIQRNGQLFNLLLEETNYLNSKCKIIERVYNICNDLYEIPICSCGEHLKFKNYKYGYNKYCSLKCRSNSEDWSKKVKTTKLERYGDENYSNCEKGVQTRLEKYGSKNNFEKVKKTKLEKYGDSYFNNYDKIKKTKIRKYGEIKNKMIEENIKNKNMNFLKCINESINKNYLTEDKLGNYLKIIYPNEEFIHNKKIPDIESRIRPDYRCDNLKLIVEFDGYKHYTQYDKIITEHLKNKLYKKLGYGVIRIPYFVQLSKDIIKC